MEKAVPTHDDLRLLRVWAIQSGGDLVELKEQPYDTEAVLQELLAR